MPRVIVFDVNETLLDLSGLDPAFDRIFGKAEIRRKWFQQVLQSALVSTIIGEYADFTTVQYAALDMTARRLAVTLSPADRTAIVDGMKSLPPHTDVLDALNSLRSAGFWLVALTNSPPDVAEAQLTHAGIRDYFERVLSVDDVRCFKPARQVYESAAACIGIPIDQMRMVAAHPWDVAGAMHAGAVGAFVARPGMVLDPLFPPPDIVSPDLRGVSEQIVARDQP